MSFITQLKQLLANEQILTAQAGSAYYSDHRGRYQGTAEAVVFPHNTQQVAELVKLCQHRHIAIVPQGGNTSLCGASVPSGTQKQLVINLSKMNQIRAIDSANNTITVEAGCTLADVAHTAQQNQRLFPLGLTAIAHRCEIGGNISTNAGGISVLRYGNMRDLVMGLEVVLASGEIWHGLRTLRKDNTGYDLKHLFIGAEGTLGIITAATLKLFPRPQATATACVAIETPQQALELLSHIQSYSGETLTAFELISRNCLDLVFKHIPNTQEPWVEQYPYYVLIKLDSTQPQPLAQQLTTILAQSPTPLIAYASSDDAQQIEAWWLLRKSISDAQKSEGFSIKHDISVPVSQVPHFIDQANAALTQQYPDIRIIAFGHMGDGNIHYNTSISNPEQNKSFIAGCEQEVNHIVYEIVQNLNGSISAEHGLGQLKREQIKQYKTATELALMKQIKQLLDPNLLLNPNKVL